MKKILSNVNVCAKTEIPIAMCLDNNYTLPTIVAMTSMLENVKEETEYKYYLLAPGDFTDENKQKILSLKEKYKSKQFEINFIDMKNEFKDARKRGALAAPTYYRLNLPSVLYMHDKCIYLDGDVVVSKDLSEFYNIDLKDNYVGGVKDGTLSAGYSEILGIKDKTKYINCGVLLMNLKKLRDDKIEDKFKWFIENRVNKCKEIICQDQDTINACCHEKIMILPPKYSFMEFFFDFYKKPWLSFYSKVHNDEALHDPVVIHYACPPLKPWETFGALFAEIWWEYAIKSGFYDKIPEVIAVEKKILELRKNPKLVANRTIDDGIYTISSKLDPNMCLTIKGDSKNNCSNLELSSRNGTDSQKFKIQYHSDGYYTIEAVCSGNMLDIELMCSEKMLDVLDSFKNILLCKKFKRNAQKWFIVPDGEGYCYVVSKCSNVCMEVASAKAENGADVHCWAMQGGDTQRFKLEKCEDKPSSNKGPLIQKNQHNFDNINIYDDCW